MSRLNNRQQPRNSNVLFFENGLISHNRITDFKKLENHQYTITRRDLIDISIVIVDIYSMGVAELIEVLGEYDNLNAIILIGFANRYSDKAKNAANEQNIGLFTYIEFYGALNYEEEKFREYLPPENKSRNPEES